MNSTSEGRRCSFVSPNVVDAVQENLRCFEKCNKVVVELAKKITSINQDTANSLLNTAETFTRKLHEIDRNSSGDNESLVNSIYGILDQLESQGKSLKRMCKGITECIITPMQQDKKLAKRTSKACFEYVRAFNGNTRKMEDELVKCKKEYNDAVSKSKISEDPKHVSFVGNSHNTQLLQSVALETANKMFSSYVLPKVLNSIEDTYGELGFKLKRHLRSMFTLQKQTLTKLGKSFEEANHSTEQINIRGDLNKFIEGNMSFGFKESRGTKLTQSIRKSFHLQRTSAITGLLTEALTVSESTEPNLKRSVQILMEERNNNLSDISSMDKTDDQRNRTNSQNDDSSIQNGQSLANTMSMCRGSLLTLNNMFATCDNHVQLRIIEEQLRMFTPNVLEKIGSTMILSHAAKPRSKTFNSFNETLEEDTTSSSPKHRAHRYIEARLMRPQVCTYCNKWLTMVTKGLSCTVCKITVHKKCVMNVPFCDGGLPDDSYGTVNKEFDPVTRLRSYSKRFSPMFSKKWDRYLAADTEDDVSSYYVDFDNIGEESSDSQEEIPEQYVQVNIDVPQLGVVSQGQNSRSSDLMFPETNIYLTPIEALETIDDQEEEEVKSPIYEKVWNEKQRGKNTLAVDDLPQIRRHSMPEFFCFPPPAYEEITGGKSKVVEHVYSRPSVREQVVLFCRPKETHDSPDDDSELSPIAYEIMLPATPIRNAYIDKHPSPVLPKPYAFTENTVEGKALSRRRSISLNNILEERTKLCVALRAYHSKHSSELSFNAGSKIEVLEKSSNSWWKGRHNDSFGFFPAQYVLEINHDDVILRVIDKFEKTRDKDLSVTAGQILVMLSEEGNWLKVRSTDGEGYVPLSYVEFVNRRYMKLSSVIKK